MNSHCIGCEVAEATVAAICSACNHLVCNAFELAEKQLLVSLPSLAASSASKGDTNQEYEAVTTLMAPLASLTESPGNIYKDPKEKAKSETRDWLNNLVTDLESQIVNFEAEAEGLTVKKGKTRPARLTHLETSISRHKAHIVKLEVVLRLLDNDGLSPDQVNDIKDFLEDYVERNQENFDEFDNADEFYSSLPLDQELEELAALGPTLVKDCSDVDDLHGTCVWAARFKFSSFAVVDTQVTKPARRRGDSDTFDIMWKKFHYITDDIMVLTAGVVPFSQNCIGILRDLKDKFELTDQNKKERTGKQRKGLVLKKLVALFLNGSNLKTFMHNVKARKGRYFAKGEEDDSTSLILISRCEETEESVCKIKLVIGDESISVHWGWAMGAGSGYSTAEKTLADLTQSSDETQIIEVVKRAFRNASKEDKGTGGSVLILKGSKDVPWDLVVACDI